MHKGLIESECMGNKKSRYLTANKCTATTMSELPILETRCLLQNTAVISTWHIAEYDQMKRENADSDRVVQCTSEGPLMLAKF